KINTNENPYPPSPKVYDALAQLNDQALRRYPPVLWDDFRQVAAKVHNVDPEMIICGNGGDELLTILVRCCCDDTRPLAYPVPTYSLYPILAKIQDNPVIEIPWGKDYSIPNALVETNAPLTILCNPNAPTGTMVELDEVKKLADALDGVLVLDEAYVDFAAGNCLPLVQQCDNVLILRSMSKGYSLAGIRFGYAIAPLRIIEAMIKVKDSYNVNFLTQKIATAALSDREYFQEIRQKICEIRQFLTTKLANLNFKIIPSDANFVFCSPPGG
ncbi:MAG: aminotransferase class I/II-fold pyridoxal phosphate-dependent enzyme, partial [Planctomycetes bacterium]|nr:aminotransferase class I/II-fold pyridoxal phosphate-dependent enzyme [Planctomycetota bacterium]